MRPELVVADCVLDLESVCGFDVDLEGRLGDPRIGEDAAVDDHLGRRRVPVDDMLPGTPEARRERYVQAAGVEGGERWMDGGIEEVVGGMDEVSCGG